MKDDMDMNRIFNTEFIKMNLMQLTTKQLEQVAKLIRKLRLQNKKDNDAESDNQ